MQIIGVWWQAISIENLLKILIGFAVVPNILGLFPILMGQNDYALYANIAKTIVNKNDWINLYVNGQDWLDKSHFQFWITAICYNFFGFNKFVYSFPFFDGINLYLFFGKLKINFI